MDARRTSLLLAIAFALATPTARAASGRRGAGGPGRPRALQSGRPRSRESGRRIDPSAASVVSRMVNRSIVASLCLGLCSVGTACELVVGPESLTLADGSPDAGLNAIDSSAPTDTTHAQVGDGASTGEPASGEGSVVDALVDSNRDAWTSDSSDDSSATQDALSEEASEEAAATDVGVADAGMDTSSGCGGDCITQAVQCASSCTAAAASCESGCSNQGCKKKCSKDEQACASNCDSACTTCVQMAGCEQNAGGSNSQ